jgi:hypothetical protein
LAALAVLFTVGTAICLLIVVVHEGGRWSVRKINEAKHAKVMRDLPFGWRRLEVDVHNATGKQADLAEIVAK